MAILVVSRSGQTVSLSRGDCIEVTQPDLGGAGYEWSIMKLPSFLVVESVAANGPEEAHQGIGAPGAAGQWRIVMCAHREGEGVVTLKLARQWEASPAKTFHINVVVKSEAGAL